MEFHTYTYSVQRLNFVSTLKLPCSIKVAGSELAHTALHQSPSSEILVDGLDRHVPNHEVVPGPVPLIHYFTFH